MKKFLLCGLAVVVCTVAAFQRPGQAQTKNSGQIHVFNRCKRQGKESPRIDALVTLYQNGQAVRSTTIQNRPGQYGFDIADQVKWVSLAPGAYEVHFQAKGYGEVIKTVIVSDDDTTDVTLDSVSRKDEVWGTGPTVAELQKRIRTLEGEVADLKKK